MTAAPQHLAWFALASKSPKCVLIYNVRTHFVSAAHAKYVRSCLVGQGNHDLQVALLRQGKASGRVVVLVQALTTPTLVAAAAADSQPAGSFVQGTHVPAVIQVSTPSCFLWQVKQQFHKKSIATLSNPSVKKMM